MREGRFQQGAAFYYFPPQNTPEYANPLKMIKISRIRPIGFPRKGGIHENRSVRSGIYAGVLFHGESRGRGRIISAVGEAVGSAWGFSVRSGGIHGNIEWHAGRCDL